MFLTPDEIVELTGKVRPSAQVRALRTMGVAHRVRPDGTPAVLRTAVDPKRCAESHTAPDWSALA